MSNILATDDLKAKVADMLEKNPRQMTIMMARKFGVSEAEVIAAHPAEVCTELDGTRVQELIQSLEKLGRVHVINNSGTCVLEAYGYFGNYSVAGGFLNVQTDTLDMHIMHEAITSAYALIKPSHQDGQQTYSILFFDREGKSSFKVFLYKSVTEKDQANITDAVAAWQEIGQKFAKNA